jgi:hypothetical protein
MCYKSCIVWFAALFCSETYGKVMMSNSKETNSVTFNLTTGVIIYPDSIHILK